MKVFGILGSPHSGNTVLLLTRCCKEQRQPCGDGKIGLAGLDLNYCVACGKCYATGQCIYTTMWRC